MPEQTENTICISVHGSTAGGKTTIMNLIHEALFKHELYNVEIFSLDPPAGNPPTGKAMTQCPLLSHDNMMRRLETLKDRNTQVFIIEGQMPRKFANFGNQHWMRDEILKSNTVVSNPIVNSRFK